MQNLSHKQLIRAALLMAVSMSIAFAQSDPWTQASVNLNTAFTGPIVRMLGGVAIVVGGLMFAYSEGSGKKAFGGIIFGLGMALNAQRFQDWLFT